MRAAAMLLLGALAISPAGAAAQKAGAIPVPSGWKIDASAKGDLTGDGIADAVVVVRRTDPKAIIRNQGLGTPELDTNPRRLLVFERTHAGYRQIGAADHLMPPAGSLDTPCLEDPLAEGEVAIARQVLSVNLHYWLSCGGWGVSSNTFKFKRSANRFRLIGFDHLEFMRNSGEGEEISVNFLTGRKSTAPYAIDDSIKKRPRWSTIRRQSLFLDTIDLSDCPKVDETLSLC